MYDYSCATKRGDFSAAVYGYYYDEPDVYFQVGN